MIPPRSSPSIARSCRCSKHHSVGRFESKELVCRFFALGFARLGLGGSGGFGSCAPEVQREKAFEDLFVAQVGGPAVSGGDGGIQFPVRVVEPRGALVVEPGERALFQLGGGLRVARFEARVANGADAGLRLDRRGVDETRPRAADRAGEFERDGVSPLGRIEPALAEVVQ